MRTTRFVEVVIVGDGCAANIALEIATAGTAHLVAPLKLDEVLFALVARPDQSFRHSLLDPMTTVELIVLRMFFAREGNV